MRTRGGRTPRTRRFRERAPAEEASAWWVEAYSTSPLVPFALRSGQRLQNWCWRGHKPLFTLHFPFSRRQVEMKCRRTSSRCARSVVDTHRSPRMENTIGDVPIQWFRDEEHIGYDADGRKILKRARVDHLDHLLQMVDDPTYWRKVFDEREDKEIDISKEQVRETIKCTL